VGVTGPITDPAKTLVVWGAGAMGGSIGAAWVREGMDVLFVDQARDHVQAMNGAGLRITGPVADFSVPVTAIHPSDLQGQFPLVFLCVKAHHTREALLQLQPHLTNNGAVVSIQNGLCELEIAEALGAGRTVGAFVNFGADYLKPGVIHRGNRGAVVLGETDGRLTPRSQEIFRFLRLFEPNAVLSENIFGFLWGKLAYAALLFATALTDDSIGDVLAAAEYRPLLIALAREPVAVAVARGVSLEAFDGFDPGAFHIGATPGAADASLDALVDFNRRSAKTHSGIWRDLAVRKRPTEVDAQLGMVARLGEEAGIPTPITNRVIRQIHEIEAGERIQSWENLKELGTSP
jgi:2-dehydropantoate 2-reductase